MSWRKVTLNEICTVQYGYTASAIEDPVGPKFLRITDIVPESISWDAVPYCEIDDGLVDKYKLEPGDIVIARTGNTTGYAKLIRESVEAVFASYLVRLKLNRDMVEPGFVGRLIESKIYKTFVESIKGGAAQGNANAKTLTLFKLSLPPKSVQKRIADILAAYDDLIENNRRRIQLLEQSAKLLYKEWFVYLRFPGHEHVKVVNGVPEGWKRFRLGDMIVLNYGKALKEENRIEGPYPVYGSSGVVGAHEKALVKGPGIILGRKGNVGSIFWSSKDFWPIDTVYFISNDQSSYYLYYALHYMQFVSSDAAVPGLNRDFASSRSYLIPKKSLLDQFEDTITPIHKQIDMLRVQNEKLGEARGLLLPRLMSGEIKV